MSWRIPCAAAAAAALLVGADSAPSPESFDYAVTAVTRKLVSERPEGEVRLAAGDTAHSGDLLRTGWWSRAELEVTERASRFLLGASTRVRLAHEHPGVLLELQQGRLRALFSPLGEDVERMVLTPSAVLAVRGTEYGVEVSGDGTTTLAVFEGVVQVEDRYRAGEAIQVSAGQTTRVRPGRAPDPPREHGLSGEDWDGGRRPPDPDRGAGGGGASGFAPGQQPGAQPGQPGGAPQPPGQSQGGPGRGKGKG